MAVCSLMECVLEGLGVLERREEYGMEIVVRSKRVVVLCV